MSKFPFKGELFGFAVWDFALPLPLPLSETPRLRSRRFEPADVKLVADFDDEPLPAEPESPLSKRLRKR